MRKFFTILFLIPFFLNAQVSMVTKDTTFLTWNARITYDQNAPSSQLNEIIIFLPGSGEVGSNVALLRVNGPHWDIASNGWDGSVVLGNGTHHPVIVSLQPPNNGQLMPAFKPRVDAIILRFNGNPNAIYGCGLSNGGYWWLTYWSFRPTAGDDTYGKQMKGGVVVEPVAPKNTFNASLPYPQRFGHWAVLGGKLWDFHQINDGGRDDGTYTQNMHDSVANSVFYMTTNISGGGHCCWGSFFNHTVTWTAANAGISSVVYGGYQAQNIYQGMLRMGDTTGGSAVNNPPIANAGPDQSSSSTTATMNGSATSDNSTISSHTWTRISGPNTPTITTPSSYSTTITGMAVGTHVFRLSATDANSLTGTDDVTIVVTTGTPPTANAGSPQTITQPASTVTLSGSGTGTSITQKWTQVAGGSVTISAPTSMTTGITGLVPGSFTFRLTVTDNGGATAFSDVVITVNSNSTGTEIITQVNLYNNSTFSDPTWNKWALDSATSFNPKRTTGENDGWIFTLTGMTDTVKDNGSSYASGQVGTLVPIGVLQEAAYTSSGTLAFSFARLNPNQLYDIHLAPSRGGTTADTVTYKLTQSTDTFNIGATNNYFTEALFTSVAPNSSGTINGTAKRKSGSAAAYINYFVVRQQGSSSNQAPQAFAGPDQVVSFPLDSVYFQGSGTDPDGTIASYFWQLAGAPGATIDSPNAQNTWIHNLDTGTYTVSLRVTDNLGATGLDQASIFSSAHTGPVALAIPRDTILPRRQFNGYGPTHTRDTTQSVCKISAGPNADQITITQVLGAAVTIVNPHAVNSNIYGFTSGDYLFKIVAKNLTDSTIKYWHVLCKDYMTINEHGFNPTPKTVHLSATGLNQMVKTNLDKTYFASTGVHIMGDDTLVLDPNPGGIPYTLVNISGFSGVKGHQVIVRVDSTVNIHGTLRIGQGNDSSVVGWAHIDFRVPSKGILFGVVNKGAYAAANNGYVLNATHHTYIAGIFADSVGVGGFVKNNQDSLHPALTMWNNFRFTSDSIFYCMVFSSGTEGGYNGDTNPNGNVGIGGNVGNSSRLDSLIVMYCYFGNTGYDGLQCINVGYLENMHNWFPNTGKLNAGSQRYTTSVGGSWRTKIMYNFGYGGKEGFVGTPPGLTEVKYNYNGRSKIGGAGIYTYSYRGEPFGMMPNSSYIEYKNIDSATFDIEYNIADVPELGAFRVYNPDNANSINFKSIIQHNITVDSLNRPASTLISNSSGTPLTGDTVFNQRGLIVDDLSTQLIGPYFRLHYIPDSSTADFTDSYAAYLWYWNKLIPAVGPTPCGPTCLIVNGKKIKWVNFP